MFFKQKLTNTLSTFILIVILVSEMFFPEPPLAYSQSSMTGVCIILPDVMIHIKEPLLLIGKSSLCGSSRFLLSLSAWSFTI